MRILVVCGAGASSTFVAQRLRRAAGDAGLAWICAAGSLSTLAAADADVVLVGPHLADRREAIIAAVPTAVVLPLPSDVFEDRDGILTLAWVRDALRSTPAVKGTAQ